METIINKNRIEIECPTPLLPHQVEAYKISRDRRFFALFQEMGTGKSAVICATANYLFVNNEIELVLILAPNGIQENWHFREIPKFCGVEFQSYYINQKHASPAYLDSLLEPCVGKLLWVSANIDIVNSTIKRQYLLALVKKFKTLMVIDESTIIKNSMAQRTKNTIAIGQNAIYRRIMSGSSTPQGPVDLFSQMRYLSPSILPFGTKTAFRNRYCVMKQMNYGARQFQKEVGYKCLDELSAFVKPHCFRVLKKDCLSLPPKSYKTLYVELDHHTARAYNNMKAEQMAILEGGVITAATVTAAMIKLQTLLSGFVYDEGKVRNVGQNCRAMQVVKFFMANSDEIFKDVKGNPRKIIIFVRYLEELNNIKRAIKDLLLEAPKTVQPYTNYVTYSGNENSEERTAAVEKFQNDPECRLFLATSAAARGLTLTAATIVVYFSQSFDLEVRVQSEDRAHRYGQEEEVVYYDVVCPGTIDMRIKQVLDKKQKVGDEIAKDWKSFFAEDPKDVQTGYEVTNSEEQNEVSIPTSENKEAD